MVGMASPALGQITSVAESPMLCCSFGPWVAAQLEILDSIRMSRSALGNGRPGSKRRHGLGALLQVPGT